MKASLFAANAKRTLVDLWLLSRPLMWVITLVPFGVGYLMALRQPGASQALCLLSTGACALDILALLVGLMVWGPLICLAVLAINDVYDVDGDALNARRNDAPVANGRLSTRSAFVIAHVAATVAVVLAAGIRWELATVTLLFLALGWLYSVPPVRLKVRPGFDVAINAIGDGGLTLLAGWTSVRSFNEFPWPIFVLGCLAAAALYIPTTVADYESDVVAGYTTVAIWLGPRPAYWLGLGFWILAGAVCVVLAARGIVLPRKALRVLAISTPTLIGLYHWAFGRVQAQRELLRGMGIVGAASLVPLLAISLMYAGIL